MTFDLERARGLRDFLQDDCAEVGDVWGEMIAEIERLRGFETAARDLSNDLTRVAKERDELQEANTNFAFQASDQAQEIERLRAEISEQKGMIWKTQRVEKEQAARIKELEDAHKRSGKKYAKIINELRSSVYANIPGLDVGKIGPDAKPQSWQITKERMRAIRMAEELAWDCKAVAVLRAMLREAGQE